MDQQQRKMQALKLEMKIVRAERTSTPGIQVLEQISSFTDSGTKRVNQVECGKRIETHEVLRSARNMQAKKTLGFKSGVFFAKS